MDGGVQVDDYVFDDDTTYAGGLFAEEQELDFGQHRSHPFVAAQHQI